MKYMIMMFGSAGETFAFVRDSLQFELGIALPPMHLRLDRTLRPRGFAVGFVGFLVMSFPLVVLATPALAHEGGSTRGEPTNQVVVAGVSWAW